MKRFFWIYCVAILMALAVAVEVRWTQERDYQSAIDRMVKESNAPR